MVEAAQVTSSLQVGPAYTPTSASQLPATEHVDLAQSENSNWVDPTTCLFNVSQQDTKVSVIIKVFQNQQVLVTITDNARFGSTYTATKVDLEA